MSASELTDAGNALMDVAEAGKTGGGGSSELSGTSSAASSGAALYGFAISKALETCESRWEDATGSMLAQISLTGDKLVLAAENYEEIEVNNAEPFRFLES